MFVGERLRLIREKNGMNQKEFSAKYALNQQNLSNYELGKRDIPDDLKIRLLKDGININWLLSGEGSMFVDDEALSAFNAATAADGIETIENARLMVKYLAFLLAESCRECETLKEKLNVQETETDDPGVSAGNIDGAV